MFKSINKTKDVLRRGSIRIISNGRETFFWSESWKEESQLKDVFSNSLIQD
jgi:hypothetical protein